MWEWELLRWVGVWVGEGDVRGVCEMWEVGVCRWRRCLRWMGWFIECAGKKVCVRILGVVREVEEF